MSEIAYVFGDESFQTSPSHIVVEASDILPDWKTYSSPVLKENMLTGTHHSHGYTAPNYQASRSGFSCTREKKKKQSVYTISDMFNGTLLP